MNCNLTLQGCSVGFKEPHEGKENYKENKGN